ncbi:MAG: SH3 domain-containing protein, partial [Lachnospiraceae bacterium]|nr:SH3 domain-containing protein [Lachnospiraceae bacterium]
MKKNLHIGVVSAIVLAVSFLLIALTADLEPKETKTKENVAEVNSTALEPEETTTVVEETKQEEEIAEPEIPSGSSEEAPEETVTEEPFEEASEEVKEEEPSKEESQEEPAEAAEPEETEDPEEPEEQAHTVDFIIANVDTALNIRSGPSTDDEIVGKLYRGGRATILERGSEWTKITSGNVTGYASNEWMMF